MYVVGEILLLYVIVCGVKIVDFSNIIVFVGVKIILGW